VKARMVKLVGVLGDDDPPSHCSARRLMPLNIEADLTMIMAVDDYCMACDVEPCGGASRYLHNHDWCNFLKNYRSLTKKEAADSLKTSLTEVVDTLGQLVPCVGCRKSVETMYKSLMLSEDSALEPLTISNEGIVSINKEHGDMEDSLANLFCCQQVLLSSKGLLDSEAGESKGSKGARSKRCEQHTRDPKKALSTENWLDTWDSMVKECKEEVVLIPCALLRETLDGYLKRHKFCTDCSYMVNRAYNLLIKDGREPLVSIGGKCAAMDPWKNLDGSLNLYGGISVCTTDKHVHVKCDPTFIGQLFVLLEPELNNIKEERHAKNIEKAQKEVLICIALTLFQRFERIQQKLLEAEKTRDLLFLSIIKTIRKNLDMAAERKRGLEDLELLCREIEGDDKSKDGKRERKRRQRAKKKEIKNNKNEKDNIIDVEISEKTEESGPKVNKCDKDEKECENCIETEKTVMEAEYQKRNKHVGWRTSLTLEDMLEDFGGEGAVIPQEDIILYLRRKKDVMARREQLREDLRKKFAQLCVKGVTPCSARN